MILINFFKKYNKLAKYGLYFIFVMFFLQFEIVHLYGQKISYPKQQIGLAYSSFSGTGINYAIELNSISVLQFSGFVYYFGENAPDDMDFYGIFGAEYQHNLFRFDKTRFYGFAGASILHLEKRRMRKYIYNDVQVIEKNITTDRIYNFGTGIGVEYNLLPQLSTSFNIGYLYQVSEVADFSEYWDRNPKGTEFNGIGIGISLRYKF